MGFRLMVASGARAGAEEKFDRCPVLIGRGTECDFVLEDPSVSRRHAKISRLPGGYLVEDLRAANGTKVNGVRVSQAPLHDADELGVGSARLRFYADAAAAADRTLSDRPRPLSKLLQSAAQLAAGAWASGRGTQRTRALVLVLGLAAIGVLAGLARHLTGSSPVPPEPSVLGGSMVAQSFGLGAGVTFSHPERKAFDYFFDAPGMALAIVHFQSRDISEGEVVVTANGLPIGSVPPDVLDADQVFHQLVIRPGLLKKGEHNRIAFESTRNPPHRDPWRVWNLWVETKALPKLAPLALTREAADVFLRGDQSFARRQIAAANGYEAWRDFRAAWLMLEALPDPKPDLYERAQARTAQAHRELDRVCASLLLKLQRSHALGDLASARAALEEVKSYFPGSDHPCPWKAQQRWAELNL